MDGQAEWWRMLSSLSSFLAPIASAIVALLIRDLLEPRQWQRYVRKTAASAFVSIAVFTLIVIVHILLLQRAGENSLLAGIVTWAVVLGIGPITGCMAYWVFNSIEPTLDWYLNPRFAFSFQNGAWPILSMDVRSECLPEDTTSIYGCIDAVREHQREFHLKVVVETEGELRTVLDRTTSDPLHGWMSVMRAVLEAQIGDHRQKREWQENIQVFRKLRQITSLMRSPVLKVSAQQKWQNDAYIQVHRLARMVEASVM